MDCRGKTEPEGEDSKSGPTIVSISTPERYAPLPLAVLDCHIAMKSMSKSRMRPHTFSNPTPVRKLNCNTPIAVAMTTNKCQRPQVITNGDRLKRHAKIDQQYGECRADHSGMEQLGDNNERYGAQTEGDATGGNPRQQQMDRYTHRKYDRRLSHSKHRVEYGRWIECQGPSDGFVQARIGR